MLWRAALQRGGGEGGEGGKVAAAPPALRGRFGGGAGGAKLQFGLPLWNRG
jgi:hypothetical protein